MWQILEYKRPDRRFGALPSEVMHTSAILLFWCFQVGKSSVGGQLNKSFNQPLHILAARFRGKYKEKHSWIAIPMGVFDTPTETKLAFHIFVAEKGGYYEITDGLPQKAY